MQKEFLQDYQEDENERIERFRQEILRQGKLTPETMFPPKERFRRLSKPYAVACLPPAASIWPQVPLYGSLIIPIFPTAVRSFSYFHGFDVSDIRKLVDFCKDTGRVQFLLAENPLSYLGLDFLEPIFAELRPPCMCSCSELLDVDTRSDNFRKWRVEFDTLSRIRFLPGLRALAREDGLTREFLLNELDVYGLEYAYLRAKGLDMIADDIENSLVDDPARAWSLLITLGRFIINPKVVVLRAIQTFNKEQLAIATEIAKNYGLAAPRVTMPCEIGTYLMEALTFVPEGIEACRDLVYHYSHRDIQNVMNAINEGAIAKNADIVRLKSDELRVIFDLVWQDMGVETKMGLAKYLIPVAIGTVGTILSPALGLLGALGFYVAEKIAEDRGESVSERVVKEITPGYAMAIYHFKKRYALDRRLIACPRPSRTST